MSASLAWTSSAYPWVSALSLPPLCRLVRRSSYAPMSDAGPAASSRDKYLLMRSSSDRKTRLVLKSRQERLCAISRINAGLDAIRDSSRDASTTITLESSRATIVPDRGSKRRGGYAAHQDVQRPAQQNKETPNLLALLPQRLSGFEIPAFRKPGRNFRRRGRRRVGGGRIFGEGFLAAAQAIAKAEAGVGFGFVVDGFDPRKFGLLVKIAQGLGFLKVIQETGVGVLSKRRRELRVLRQPEIGVLEIAREVHGNGKPEFGLGEDGLVEGLVFRVDFLDHRVVDGPDRRAARLFHDRAELAEYGVLAGNLRDHLVPAALVADRYVEVAILQDVNFRRGVALFAERVARIQFNLHHGVSFCEYIHIFGVVRFELTTTRTPCVCATKLRYTPSYSPRRILSASCKSSRTADSESDCWARRRRRSSRRLTPTIVMPSSRSIWRMRCKRATSSVRYRRWPVFVFSGRSAGKDFSQ